MSKLKIIKNTAKVNPRLVEFAFEFAKARAKKLGVKFHPKVCITKSEHRYSGWCRFEKQIVTLRFNLARIVNGLDARYPRFQNMPSYYCNGSEEVIIHLAAHEFGHCLGWDGSKTGERGCELFAAECVTAWRDLQYADPACLI